MLGAVNDFLAIVRPEGAAVITQLVGELLHVGAVGIHGVNVQVAVARGREHDVLAVPGDGGLGIVAVRAAKLFQITPIYLGRKDLIGIVDRPDVAVGIIGLRRTIRACGMSRRKQNAIAGRKEVGASSAALASAHELGYGGVSLGWVYGNRVNLIARNAFALVLENQIFVVEGEIGLGILAAKRELPNMAKMLGLFRDRRSAEGCRSWRNRVSNRPTTEQAGGGYRDKR